MKYTNPFLTDSMARGFGAAKDRQAIEQKIIEAESKAPLPSKNRYEEYDEILERPVDYHDAKAMMVYLSTAVERPIFKRNFIIRVVTPAILFALLMIVSAVVLAFTLSAELRYLLYLFCIIFAVVIVLTALAAFVDIFTYCHTWKRIKNGRYFERKDPEEIRRMALSLSAQHNEFVTRLREEAAKAKQNEES